MSSRIAKLGLPTIMLVCAGALSVPAPAKNNEVLGEIRFQADNGAAKSAGVWVDGRYVGYLNELKGSKKLLLLPGEHEISVRQGGYLDFVQKISVRAGVKQAIPVKMEKDTRIVMPKVTAEIKLDVNPNRAAVFVDGVY